MSEKIIKLTRNESYILAMMMGAAYARLNQRDTEEGTELANVTIDVIHKILTQLEKQT